MENNIKFVGLLTGIQVTPYTNRDQQAHCQVDFTLESDERIPQSLRLKVRGSMGDQLVALGNAGVGPECNRFDVVAHIEFHTFVYADRLCQEIRPWKLELTDRITGQSFTIVSQNPNSQHYMQPQN